MELKLRYYPDPILRKVAEPVDTFDAELEELARSMVETMHRERGIGLAAPQVGVGRRLIVALQMKDPDDTEVEALVLVNPRLISTSGELWTLEEGCLSIPGVNAQVIRPVQAEVEYRDLAGKTHRVTASGMFARILQHEIDHLNGKLFIDYLSTAQKSLIRPKLKSLAEKETA